MKVCNRLLLYLSFSKNWNKKPFFFLELLNVYKIFDFTVLSGSEVYIWWRHQKMLMSAKIFLYILKAYVYMCKHGVYNYNVLWLAFLNQKLR